MSNFKTRIKNEILANVLINKTDIELFHISIKTKYSVPEVKYVLEDIVYELCIPYEYVVVDNEVDYGIIFVKKEGL